jgi:hypothetical protein
MVTCFVSTLGGRREAASAGVLPEVPDRDWQQQRQRAEDPGGGREDDCGVAHFNALPDRR